MEKTLVLIKPDAVKRGLIGKIIQRFEERGMKIIGMKMMELREELLNEHYAHLRDKPFFPRIVNYMTMGPVIAMAVEGVKAVEMTRKMAGATNPAEAEPGTIRFDFGQSIGRNIIHASDSVETAMEEIRRFFKPGEIFEYEKTPELVYSEEDIE